MKLFYKKVPKPHFWVIFGNFCPKGIFSKDLAVSCLKPQAGPSTMLIFRKKLINQIQENFRTKGLDGRIRTHIQRTILDKVGALIFSSK